MVRKGSEEEWEATTWENSGGERGGSETLGGHLGEGCSRGEEESEKTGSDIHR